jgi:hypothetical protein
VAYRLLHNYIVMVIAQPNATNCIHGPHVDTNDGNFYAIGFATNINRKACWEFTKAIAARAESCIVGTRCPAPVSASNIAAISLSGVLMAIASIATTLTFMKYYNFRKKFKESSQPDALAEIRDQLRQRLV